MITALVAASLAGLAAPEAAHAFGPMPLSGQMAIASIADEAACRATDRYGNAIWLDFVAQPGPWRAHTLSVSVGDGSGVYARLAGAGTLTRMMHIPAASAGPWGFFAGSVTWRRA